MAWDRVRKKIESLIAPDVIEPILDAIERTFPTEDKAVHDIGLLNETQMYMFLVLMANCVTAIHCGDRQALVLERIYSQSMKHDPQASKFAHWNYARATLARLWELDYTFEQLMEIQVVSVEVGQAYLESQNATKN